MRQLLNDRLVLIRGGHAVLVNQIEDAFDEHVLEVQRRHAFLEVAEADLPEAVLALQSSGHEVGPL